MAPAAEVVAVACAPGHGFSKPLQESVRLLTGLGVQGDAHAGETVRHRSRVRADPTQPNLRQVHLLAAELLDELNGSGFVVAAGDLGENVLTRGLDLLGLPAGTRLSLGGDAVVEVTGLRNPCAQIDGFQPGLLAAVLARDDEGALVRRAGIMGVVRAGGLVSPGDRIAVTVPAGPHVPLPVV